MTHEEFLYFLRDSITAQLGARPPVGPPPEQPPAPPPPAAPSAEYGLGSQDVGAPGTIRFGNQRPVNVSWSALGPRINSLGTLQVNIDGVERNLTAFSAWQEQIPPGDHSLSFWFPHYIALRVDIQ